MSSRSDNCARITSALRSHHVTGWCERETRGESEYRGVPLAMLAVVSPARAVGQMAQATDGRLNDRHFCLCVNEIASRAPAFVGRLPIPLSRQCRFPHISLFNITSHLSHLAPVRPDRPQRMAIGRGHRILTILARNNGSRTVCARTDTEVLSWGRTGEIDHSRLSRGGQENRPLPRSI